MLLVATAFTSCQTLDGFMNVSSPFRITQKHTCNDYDDYCPPAEDKYVPTGHHDTELKVHGKRSASLVVNAHGDRIVADINLPRGQELPKYEGDISIPGDQMDQDFDLQGRVSSNYYDSSTTYTTESCTKTEVRTMCRWVNKSNLKKRPNEDERRRRDRDGDRARNGNRDRGNRGGADRQRPRQNDRAQRQDDRAQRQADRARRQADQARRDANRARRQADRARRDADQARRDADRARRDGRRDDRRHDRRHGDVHRRVPPRHTDHRSPRQVCRDEVVTVSGWQDVQFHYSNVDTQVTFDLTSFSGEHLASFNASKSESNKVYTHRGYCH